MAKPKEPKPPKPPTKKLRKEWFKAYGNDDAAAIAAHLDAGVDPNAITDLDWERTALGVALDRHRAPKIARLLLDRGVDVKVAGPKGVTALHQVHDRAFAAELVERGADVNARDEHGRTPLHSAASGGRVQPVVEELLARGADVNATDNFGKTAYQMSHEFGVRAAMRAAGAPGLGAEGKTLNPVVVRGAAKTEAHGDRGAIGVAGRDVWIWGYTGFFRYDGFDLAKYDFEESFAVHDIAATRDAVYFGTNWGLLRLVGSEWRLFSSEDSELFDHHLTFATAGPDGRVYMLSYEREAEDKHITVFDGRTFDVLVPGTDFPLGLELKRICFDRDGQLMLCGRGGFAFRKDGAWVVLRRFEEQGFEATVYDAVDDGDAVWVGTQSGVYERRGDATTKHDVKKLAKHLLADRGTIWVGTYFGGLARIRGGEVTIFDEKNSPLPADDVNGLARGADGTIWVLTANGVAYVSDDEVRRFE